MVHNTAPLNYTGHPALALPSGHDADGLPTSVQLVARAFEDGLTIRAGAVLEAALADSGTAPSLIAS